MTKLKKISRTLKEIKIAQHKLKQDKSDLEVHIKMLDEEAPKNGVFLNWNSDPHEKEQYEFRYRGSKKQLRKIINHILK